MPGLTGFDVTLADVLMARGSPLPEDDLWAVLAVSCRSLEDLLRRDKSSWAAGPSLLITMDTLMMSRSGEVQFCPGHLDVNDPGSFAPPETFANNYEITRPSVEKMYVYSLGMTMYSAAEFETDKNTEMSEELEGVLLNMCEETAEIRHSLTQVLEVCNEHACSARRLPYSDQVTQLMENLMGSSAVLDKLGRSMDDLDVEDEDANLEEELAEALRMQKRATSFSSLRSSTVSTPLNVLPIQSDSGTEQQEFTDGGQGIQSAMKSEDTTAHTVPDVPVESPQVSNRSPMIVSTDLLTCLAAASAAVVMAAPVLSTDLCGAMPAAEASQVSDLLQCKASPEIFSKVRHETVPKAVEENLPDDDVPPPLPESEPPPLPDTPYPDDIPEAGAPPVSFSSHPPGEEVMDVVEQNDGMQNSSGVMESVGQQQPPATVQQDEIVEPVVVAVQQETVESAPNSESAVTKSTSQSILSAVMSLPGTSFFARFAGSDSKPSSVTSKPPEAIEASEPIARSTPVPSREASEEPEPEPGSSWSGIHAELAAAAVEVRLHQKSAEQKRQANESKVDNSPYATTAVAAVSHQGDSTISSSSDSPDRSRHVEGLANEPTYAKVDLSKKRKYRQTTESDAFAMKNEESRTGLDTEMTGLDESSNRLEETSHAESLVDVSSSMSPQHGALPLDRTVSSASEASQISSRKRKKRKKNGDQMIGTIYGDEWPSVTKQSSKSKLKKLFGHEFSKLHGDPRRQSVAVFTEGQTKLPAGRKLVTVVLLDGTNLSLSAEMRSTVRELFDEVASHLSLKDKEDYFFGLTVKIPDYNNEEWFMDPNKKLKKYSPPGWKDQTQKSVKFLTYFRVKYYVDKLTAIRYVHTVHLFYLQLRHDVLHGQMFCHRDSALVLASYALQADHGDYMPGNPEYFQPGQYIRESILNEMPENFAKESLPKMHAELGDMTKQQAMIEYIREAQRLSDYGIFFYDVCRDEKGEMGSTVLGTSVGGIAVYEATGSQRSPVEKYAWHETRWVTYKEKRFTLVPKPSGGHEETAKRVFFTGSYKRSRYLLQMCTDLHHFRLVITKKLQTESAFNQEEEAGLLTESDTDAETMSRKSMLVHALAASSPSLSVGRSPLIHVGGSPGQDSPLPQLSDEVKTVMLMKSPERGLGLMIVGGLDHEKGDSSGIYVKSIKPGGVAALDGRIKPGCQILELNGHSLKNKSHSEVVELLRTAPSLVELKVVQTSLAIEFDLAVSNKIEEEEEQPHSVVEEEPKPVRVAAVADVEHSEVDQSQQFVVKLKKIDGSLGLKVTGGTDTGSRNGAVYVKELTLGGAAERDGQLLVGDRLLKVDAQTVVGVTHAQAVQRLKETGSEVDIQVERIPGMPGLAQDSKQRPVSMMAAYESVSGEVFVLDLTKDEKGLGFGLVGGLDVDQPIIVKSIFDGQVAARDGRLKVGDVLLEVNGKRIQSMFHKDVVDLLRQSPPAVHLVVHRPSSPIVIPSDSIVPLGRSVSPKNGRDSIQPAFLSAVAPDEERLASIQELQERTPTPAPTKEEASEISVNPDISLVEVFGEKLLGRIFELELSRGVKGLGFSVTSGARSATDDTLILGCFIRAVVANPALSDGRLEAGDQLLKVNSTSLQSRPHSEAVSILRGTEGELMKLVAFRRVPAVVLPLTEENIRYETPSPPMSPVSGTAPPLPPQPDPWEDILVSICLQKSDKGYGFSMYVMPKWGVDPTTGTSFDCVYVKRITQGLPADVDGRLKMNDRLVEIDDEVIEGLPYYQVINRLRRTEGAVEIKVARREEQRREDRAENEELDLDVVQRVITPITGRRPVSSPGHIRREVELRGTSLIDRSDINELELTEDFRRYPTPVPDDFGPPTEVVRATVGSTHYREETLAELCRKVENQLNDETTADEYLLLRESKLPASCNIGRLPKNKPKNRFSNLLPFDHSRVKLRGDDQSDYINASNIRIRVGPVFHKFICTQGPVGNTIGDFWRMVWQQHCTVIAMVTKLKEAGKEKCSAYWPKNVNQTKKYARDTLAVTLLSQKDFDTYCVRILRVKYLQGDGSRDIVHFQFTGWPDHGVPKSPAGFLELTSAVKNRAAQAPGPVVVHCSAGMGRTAVAVVVSSLLCMIESDLEVDIADIVRTLRDARPNMIQKKEQYLFCFACYLHALRALRVYQWQPPDDAIGMVVNTERSTNSSVYES